jgi:CDP-paratose 2-epimerase
VGREMTWSYVDQNRIGDHMWWIGDNGRFQSHYPEWRLEYDVEHILKEIHELNLERWSR